MRLSCVLWVFSGVLLHSLAFAAPRVDRPKSLHLGQVREFAAANDYLLDTVQDSSSNIYTAGATDGSISGFSNAGGLDIIVYMVNSAGVVQWSQQIGTAADESAYAVAVDDLGNLYVGGYTGGSLPSFSNSGGNDMFLMKFNSTGVLQWTQQFGTTGNDILYALTTDATNNPILCGSTGGSFPGYSNFGGLDIVAQERTAAAGAITWTRQVGTTADEECLAASIDNNNRAYIAGNTSGSFSGFTNAGGEDTYLARLSTAGAVNWQKQDGTSGNDYIFSLPCTTGGVCYPGGTTDGAWPGFTNAGLDDAFFFKRSAAGALTYVEQFGTSGNDSIRGGRVDSNGRPTFVGKTSGSFPGYTIAGQTDLFFSRWSSGGNQQSLIQHSAPKSDEISASGKQMLSGVAAAGGSNEPWTGFTSLKGYDGYIHSFSTTGVLTTLQQVGSSN